jgi:hypothetical protein
MVPEHLIMYGFNNILHHQVEPSRIQQRHSIYIKLQLGFSPQVVVTHLDTTDK